MRFTTLLTLAGPAIAAPHVQRYDYVIKEVHNPPVEWTRLSAAPADHVLSLTFGLKQGRFGELTEHLSKSSDPSHKLYGAHLSPEEVGELIKPNDETLTAVHDWFAANGIDAEGLSYSPEKDWISVRLPVSKVESLLNTEYSIYEHEDGDMLVRTPEWSLPMHLHDHIDVVQPTNSFFRTQKPSKKNKEKRSITVMQSPETAAAPANQAPAPGNISAVCNTDTVTIECLRTLYGTINYQAQVPEINHMGINNFLGEVNNRSDTYLFLKQYRPEAAQGAYDFKTQVIANGNNYQGPLNSSNGLGVIEVEGDLDSETMLGIAWPTRLTTFNTGGSPPYQADTQTPTDTNEPYLTWLQAVLGEPDLPFVVSTSYSDDEQTVPYSYASRVCDGFAQLGARGISLFFGSGDLGVGASGTCISNQGNNASTFLSQFPSGCPYITSVGATKFFNPEVVATDSRNGFVSGGGFSRYFPRPKYQDSVVPAYVKSLGTQFQGLYNPNGRGYPDVAAQGYRFALIYDGKFAHVDGTSASTPTFAAVVTLINDALIASGRPTLGFLNPWLYAQGYQGLTDVTIGSAMGCNTTGFPAEKGWDAVTGFGTPQFGKLVQLAKQSGALYHGEPVY